MNAMLDGLRNESLLFATVWKEQLVLDREGGLRLFSHPGRGVLTFEQHTFRPSDRPDYKLVLLQPA
jgi:hypothetical protein